MNQRNFECLASRPRYDDDCTCYDRRLAQHRGCQYAPPRPKEEAGRTEGSKGAPSPDPSA